MEKKILLLLAWLMLAVTGCSANDPQTDSPDTPPVEKPEEPAEPSGNRKILIVYFSHTGNTRTIAGYIHDTVKSDLVEIETVDTYTDDYDTLLAQIREEVATEYCPPLTTRIEDIDLYDVIHRLSDLGGNGGPSYPLFPDNTRPCRKNRCAILHQRNQFCRGELSAHSFPLPAIYRFGGHTDSQRNIRHRIRPCYRMVTKNRYCRTESRRKR